MAEHQTYNIGVKAVIVKGRRVLLLKRADKPVWELPGGRINSGEDAQQTLVREIAEELPGSANCEVGDIVHAEQTDFTLPNGNRLMLLCFNVRVDMPPVLRISNEHIDVCWATAGSIEGLHMQPALKQAALRALTTS